MKIRTTCQITGMQNANKSKNIKKPSKFLSMRKRVKSQPRSHRIHSMNIEMLVKIIDHTIYDSYRTIKYDAKAFRYKLKSNIAHYQLSYDMIIILCNTIHIISYSTVIS